MSSRYETLGAGFLKTDECSICSVNAKAARKTVGIYSTVGSKEEVKVIRLGLWSRQTTGKQEWPSKVSLHKKGQLRT